MGLDDQREVQPFFAQVTSKLICWMLPALKVVVAVSICTITVNLSILSDASAMHSFTAACIKFHLEYLLKEWHCHIRQP